MEETLGPRLAQIGRDLGVSSGSQLKVELADAILVQDGALIRNLTAEDLELLLS